MSVQTDIKLIDNASKVLAGINDKVDKLHDKVDAINNTSIKPKDMIETESAFSRLVGGGKDLLGAFSKISVSLYGIKEIFNGISSVVGTITNYSDTLSETTARLNLMNDGLISTDELWNEIYLSSMRSRGSIVDTADAVAKLGLTTKGVFKDNKELVQFSENLTKSFKIAGTSTQGISSAMLQLTQAMSSGVLRGEELNSIFENAPLLIQNIADYMGVPIGQIRKLAKEGQITSDIVKNAILGATDDINQKFDAMPMKFEDVSNKFNTIAISAFQPFHDELEKTPEKIDALAPHWEAFAYAINDVLTQSARDFNVFFDEITRRTREVRSELSHLAAIGLFTTADEIKTEHYGKKLAKQQAGGLFNLDYYFITHKERTDLLESTERDASARFILENADKKGLLLDEEKKLLTHLQKGGALGSVANGTVISHDEAFGKSQYEKIINTDWEKRIEDKAAKLIADNEGIEKPSYEPISLPKNDISGIARDVSDISKSINNLNDLNKAIMEINEATYHNNVANQFNGNIEIVAYGVDEEGQKAIGKSTEEAIRRVFLNDYQNMQAMGVYA